MPPLPLSDYLFCLYIFTNWVLEIVQAGSRETHVQVLSLPPGCVSWSEALSFSVPSVPASCGRHALDYAESCSFSFSVSQAYNGDSTADTWDLVHPFIAVAWYPCPKSQAPVPLLPSLLDALPNLPSALPSCLQDAGSHICTFSRYLSNQGTTTSPRLCFPI